MGQKAVRTTGGGGIFGTAAALGGIVVGGREKESNAQSADEASPA